MNLELNLNTINPVLRHAIKEREFNDWMENFLPEERETAFKVLDKIDYFTHERIICNLEDLLLQLLEKFPFTKILLYPIGTLPKSGPYLSRNIEYSAVYDQNRTFLKNCTSPSALENEMAQSSKFVLVLYDDFFGSGETVVSFVHDAILNQSKKVSLKDAIASNSKKIVGRFFLALKFTNDAKRRLGSEFREFEVIGENLPKAIEGEDALIKDPVVQKDIRAVCQKYHRQNSWNRAAPLGFNNSQSLLTFYYRCPDNNFPIFWESKGNWKFIFPRWHEEKSQQANERQGETNFLLAAHHLGIKSSQAGSQEHSLKKSDYIQIAVLKFVFCGCPEPEIQRLLQLTKSELQRVTQKLVDDGRMSLDGGLTQAGEQLLEKINLEIVKIEEKKANFRNIDYLPQSIKGKGLVEDD